MITVHGKSPDGKPLLLIGICDGHVAMLKEEGGMRIVTPEGLIIDLVYADTEPNLIAQLKTAGLIHENIEVAVEKAPSINTAKILKLDSRIVPPPANGSNN
jgi:hypothetical protein